MNDAELIDAYFNSPAVIVKMNMELGFKGRVAVDWEKRTVVAAGSKQARSWDLDEMLHELRLDQIKLDPPPEDKP